MTPSERYAALMTLGTPLSNMHALEADRALRMAGSSEMTPEGWGGYPSFLRETEVRTILEEQSDDVLNMLLDFFYPGQAARSEEVPQLVDPEIPQSSAPTATGPIFVVHGHARAALHETVRVLERGTRRDVIVLREQPNAGRTILEKFEDHAAGVAFAVVLLTGDDQGGIRSSNATHLRGRQNVVFELGFFFGKLGRDRVAVLLEEGVEQPSDIEGLVYITLDQPGAWKQALARELEAAGIPVDRSRIP